MDVVLILITLAVTLLLHRIFRYYQQRKKFWDALEPIGGPKWYPIIGTTYELFKAKREDFFEAYMERNNRYGPFFRTWVGCLPSVHLMKAELAEPILTSSTNLTKSESYRFTKPWLGDGLVTGSGSKWRAHRKLITPTFHFKILDAMNEIFVDKSQTLADKIEKQSSPGKFIDVFRLLTLCALDVICETAMGVEINAMNCSNTEYVEAVCGITDIIIHRLFRPYLHPDFIFNRTSVGRKHKKYLEILHRFTRTVIQERKQKLEGNQVNHNELSNEDILLGKKKRLAFLDLLLEANKRGHAGLSDEDIREEVDTFMFAGHDTTTATVAMVLLTLGNYPEIQSNVHEELDNIFHGEERPITPQDISEMQYLDRVIKETLRLIPVIPVIARSLDTDVEINGHVIPAGVTAAIHIHEIHHDPEQFPNPEQFDPNRFLPERSKERHPYAFIPFSAGPRNCLGQKFAQRNSKIILATILRRFKIKSMKKIDEVKFYSEIVLRPQGGLYMAFEKR